MKRTRHGRVEFSRLSRQINFAVKLILDHERKVPQIGVNEDGRDDYATQKDEEKSDAETLKLNDPLNLKSYYFRLIPLQLFLVGRFSALNRA